MRIVPKLAIFARRLLIPVSRIDAVAARLNCVVPTVSTVLTWCDSLRNTILDGIRVLPCVCVHEYRDETDPGRQQAAKLTADGHGQASRCVRDNWTAGGLSLCCAKDESSCRPSRVAND